MIDHVLPFSISTKILFITVLFLLQSVQKYTSFYHLSFSYHCIYWCRSQCWRYLLPLLVITSNTSVSMFSNLSSGSPPPSNIITVFLFSRIRDSPPSLWVVLKHLWLLGLELGLSSPAPHLTLLILPLEGPAPLALSDKHTKTHQWFDPVHQCHWWILISINRYHCQDPSCGRLCYCSTYLFYLPVVNCTFPQHWYQAWNQTGASPWWRILYPCLIKLRDNHVTWFGQQNLGGRAACHLWKEAVRASLWFCYLSFPTATRLVMFPIGAAPSAWVSKWRWHRGQQRLWDGQVVWVRNKPLLL